jgi:flagellar basal body rod protein FlgG
MVQLIEVQRTFETLTRMIESYKAIDERTARDVGNPR